MGITAAYGLIVLVKNFGHSRKMKFCSIVLSSKQGFTDLTLPWIDVDLVLNNIFRRIQFAQDSLTFTNSIFKACIFI